MFRFSPFSALGTRIPQVFSWFFDPNQYTTPFFQKVEEKRKYNFRRASSAVFSLPTPKKIEWVG